MRRLLSILLIAMIVAPSLPVPVTAATRPAHPAERVVKALRVLPATQTAAPADEDELNGFEIVPIDPGLDPDDILRSRPFVMGDLAYETAFPGLEPRRPNNELETDEGAQQALVDFLSLRGVDGGAIDGAVKRFNDRKVKKIVPSPRLRSALLMLTDWDPYKAVISAILDGKNPSGEPYLAVVFETTGMDGAIATLHEDYKSGRHVLTFDTAHDNDEPELLIPVIVHEALHGGGGDSAEEEIAANLLDAICWGELLLIKPELATYGTDLTLFNNVVLLGLLNSSGRAGPGQVGVATSNVGDIYVGDGLKEYDAESLRAAVELNWLYDALRNIGSEGQQTTAALVRRFPGGKDLGKSPRYDERLLAVIDAGSARSSRPNGQFSLPQSSVSI